MSAEGPPCHGGPAETLSRELQARIASGIEVWSEEEPCASMPCLEYPKTPDWTPLLKYTCLDQIQLMPRLLHCAHVQPVNKLDAYSATVNGSWHGCHTRASPVVAFQSSREDLCSAGSPAVDQDDHWLGGQLRWLLRIHLQKHMSHVSSALRVCKVYVPRGTRTQSLASQRLKHQES